METAKRKAADAAKREAGQRRFAERFAERYGDRFEYLGGFVSTHSDEKPLLRCKVCSHEFRRYVDWDYEIRCPECHKREVEAKANEVKRHAVYFKRCEECGEVFITEYKTAKRCSNACQRRYKNRRTQERRNRNGVNSRASHRKRARKYGCEYDPSVTLPKLIERDGLTCYLCGKECDSSDKSWGPDGPTYPSVDHVIAMANGGGHTWDNVRVAHVLCNSEKRDLMLG